MHNRFRVLAVALAMLTLVLFLRVAVLSITTSVPRVVDLEVLPVIVIDAGHGGIDGGAVSPSDVVEKEINLALALQLRDLFITCGFDVVMTRDDDRSIHDEGVTGTKKQKTSDLHNRLEIVEALYPNVIFLSIHQNKFANTSSHGAQIFYSPNHEDSERLAGVLQDTIIQMVQPENNRQIKPAEKNLFLMYKATCPAALIECGFLSNIEDTRNLQDPVYQKKLSFAILSAVLSYLGLDQPSGSLAEKPTGSFGIDEPGLRPE